MKRKDAENQIEFYKTPEPLEEYEKSSLTLIQHYLHKYPNPTGKFKNND